MKPCFADILVCPESGRPLALEPGFVEENGRVRTGGLVEEQSGARYEIRDFIPRFVPEENYSKNFGIEWNIHNQTQYDDHTGMSVSKDRFSKETKWGDDLSEQTILEVGSGSGRFTTEAIKTGAMVVSLDYSSAVEANYRKNGGAENLLLVQASVYDMPVRDGAFDRAFCFGVLQHTPNPEESFRAIVKKLRPGGHIASDIYPKSISRWLLNTKYWVRPFTKNVDPDALYGLCKRYVNAMWPIARIVRRIPKIGPIINWRLLIADYSRTLKDRDESLLKEWAYLDTYDMLSPKYDLPARLGTFRRWHQEADLESIEVHYGYNGIEGRGRRRIGDRR